MIKLVSRSIRIKKYMDIFDKNKIENFVVVMDFKQKLFYRIGLQKLIMIIITKNKLLSQDSVFSNNIQEVVYKYVDKF